MASRRGEKRRGEIASPKQSLRFASIRFAVCVNAINFYVHFLRRCNTFAYACAGPLFGTARLGCACWTGGVKMVCPFAMLQFCSFAVLHFCSFALLLFCSFAFSPCDFLLFVGTHFHTWGMHSKGGLFFFGPKQPHTFVYF